MEGGWYSRAAATRAASGSPWSTIRSPEETSVGVGEFPRACRLRRSSEFSAVYQRGARKSSRSFVVFILPNDCGASRFGLTTSRKIGRAHERNRIRRRVREILRTSRDLLPTGVDVVVNPRKSVGDRAFAELRAELVSLIRGDAV